MLKTLKQNRPYFLAFLCAALLISAFMLYIPNAQAQFWPFNRQNDTEQNQNEQDQQPKQRPLFNPFNVFGNSSTRTPIRPHIPKRRSVPIPRSSQNSLKTVDELAEYGIDLNLDPRVALDKIANIDRARETAARNQIEIDRQNAELNARLAARAERIAREQAIEDLKVRGLAPPPQAIATVPAQQTRAAPRPKPRKRVFVPKPKDGSQRSGLKKPSRLFNTVD